MSPKATALDKKRLASRRSRQAIDWKRIAFPIVITLSVAGLLWCLYQIGAGVWRGNGADRLLGTAQQLAQDLGQTLSQQRQQVAAAAQSDLVTQAVRSGQADVFRSAERQLEPALPGASRVRLLNAEIELLQPEAYPGLDYAALALLLQAKQARALIAPSLGLTQTDNAHISWAAPLMAEGTTRVQALLLVSYPFSVIRSLYAQVSARGYLDLRTKRSFGGNTIMLSQGVLFATSSDQVATIAVDDTRFEVGYALADPPFLSTLSGFQLTLLLLLSIAIAVAAVMLRYGWSVSTLRPLKSEREEPQASAPSADQALRSAMAFTEELESKPSGAAVALSPTIFRAYDIRGIVGQTLTAETAEQIGRAVGSEALDRGQAQLVVARDGRLSGPELVEALTQGLIATGVDVIDIGAVPTGVLYFATHHLGTGSGVMVTGSHNPADYNGFKIVLAGETLAADAIQALYQRIVDADFNNGEGGVQEMDVLEDYVERIASDVQVEEPLKVVVDCGNGIAGAVGPMVLEEIGCEVVPLFAEIDGNFPNHHPDPSDPENLQDLIVTVAQMEADLGIAFDGDGDRLGVVTKEGNIVYPDRLLMMFAQDVLTRNPGAAIIYDVKCTGHLAKVILGHGGSPLMWKTGHSLIKAKMSETNAALAGEMSGHFFFKERWYGFDDGIYAAARLLEILASLPEHPSEALEALPSSVSTPEIKVEMAEGAHYELVAQFQAKAQFDDARVTTIDGIRADFEDGWGLVRCSNTTPCLVMRFDAVDEQALGRIQALFKAQLLAIDPDLPLPF